MNENTKGGEFKSQMAENKFWKHFNSAMAKESVPNWLESLYLMPDWLG